MVQRFEKRFTVPLEVGRSVFDLLCDMVATSNSKSVGKNRRGTLFITGLKGTHGSSGDMDIVIDIERGTRLRAYRRLRMCRFFDWSKCLRKLSKANRR